MHIKHPIIMSAPMANPIPCSGIELLQILQELKESGEFCAALDVEPSPGWRKNGWRPMYRVHHAPDPVMQEELKI